MSHQVCFHVFFVCCCFFVLVFVFQMSPIKKNATKKSLKQPRTSLDSFRNDDANMAFLDHYKWALIVLERSVDLESLEGTFIRNVFKERTWKKLLNPMGDVFEDIIREFFANAIVEGDHINCWLMGREFFVSRESIQEVLEIRLTTPNTSFQYDERKEKLEPLVEVLGGQLCQDQGRCSYMISSLTRRSASTVTSITSLSRASGRGMQGYFYRFQALSCLLK